MKRINKNLLSPQPFQKKQPSRHKSTLPARVKLSIKDNHIKKSNKY